MNVGLRPRRALRAYFRGRLEEQVWHLFGGEGANLHQINVSPFGREPLVPGVRAYSPSRDADDHENPQSHTADDQGAQCVLVGVLDSATATVDVGIAARSGRWRSNIVTGVAPPQGSPRHLTAPTHRSHKATARLDPSPVTAVNGGGGPPRGQCAPEATATAPAPAGRVRAHRAEVLEKLRAELGDDES